MKIILASHGYLADEMLSVLRSILGDDDEDDVESFCLDTYDDPSALSEAIKKSIDQDSSSHFILVCDIKGGDVFNHLLPLCEIPGVSLVSGMNLDLVLSLVNIQPETEADFEEVIGEGRAGIQCFNMDTLEKMQDEDKDPF